ncbi:MAG: hypothetical protein K1Y02_11675 [Candidatus Hydrogenedentes bacterium]|nr:hypothetical protein [Candidatus Hydrogenedentota bacterium]
MTRIGKTQSGRASEWMCAEREASKDLGTEMTATATPVLNASDPSIPRVGNPLMEQAFFVVHGTRQVRFGRA